jgi:hypothetical protein
MINTGVSFIRYSLILLPIRMSSKSFSRLKTVAAIKDSDSFR